MKLQTVRNKLRWDNVFLREIPGDFGGKNVPRQVRGSLYCGDVPPTAPDPPAGLRLVAHSPPAASLIGLDASDVRQPSHVAALGGCAVFAGSEPYAHRYGGHQFGEWSGQLGDGRALSLGEVLHSAGAETGTQEEAGQSGCEATSPRCKSCRRRSCRGCCECGWFLRCGGG